MVTKGRMARLSLRAKFKDTTTVEVAIVDHESGETIILLWSFREGKVSKKSKQVVNGTEITTEEDD